jgi:hypothetical protein
MRLIALRRVLHRLLISVAVTRPAPHLPWTLRGRSRSRLTLARRADPCSTVPAKSTPDRPKLPTDIRPSEGVADPGYLLAEVTELRDIADRGGLGTLAYILECARLECIALIQKQELDALAAPRSSMQGAADLPYVLGQVDELREIAERAGFSTLAYGLDCARLECVWLIEQQKAERRA